MVRFSAPAISKYRDPAALFPAYSFPVDVYSIFGSSGLFTVFGDQWRLLCMGNLSAMMTMIHSQ